MNSIIYNLISGLTDSGKIFSASFTKADGSERIILCRTGVKKDLKGKGLNYDPRKVHNLIVWDLDKEQYRTIKTDRLNWIKTGGKKFIIEHNGK